MRKIIGLATILSTFAVTGLAVAADAGSDSAQRWLSLVDKGDYAASWTQAGALFQSQLTAPNWAAKLAPLRDLFGAVVSRKLAGSTEKTSLPGAPDGRYEIVQFATVFAHKQQSVETVVLARQGEAWAVDGYFIK